MVPSLTNPPSTRSNHKEMVYGKKHIKYKFLLDNISITRLRRKDVLVYLEVQNGCSTVHLVSPEKPKRGPLRFSMLLSCGDGEVCQSLIFV